MFTVTASEKHYDSLEREQDFMYLKLTMFDIFSQLSDCHGFEEQQNRQPSC